MAYIKWQNRGCMGNKEDLKLLCYLNTDLYSCITAEIATEKVVLTNKAVLHILDHHPEAYNEVLIELKQAILEPDYIIKDEKHLNTGLVIKEIASDSIEKEHAFIVLKICTDTKNNQRSNSIISGWKISNKRLKSYLRNKTVLYKKDFF